MRHEIFWIYLTDTDVCASKYLCIFVHLLHVCAHTRRYKCKDKKSNRLMLRLHGTLISSMISKVCAGFIGGRGPIKDAGTYTCGIPGYPV